jgi:hypothetical protein
MKSRAHGRCGYLEIYSVITDPRASGENYRRTRICLFSYRRLVGRPLAGHVLKASCISWPE